MNHPHRTTTPRRTAATALAGLAALAAMAVPAVADTPVFEMPARFTAGDALGGSLVPDGPPNHAAVRGYPGAGAVGAHWATQTYCTPYGPGTAIVGFQYLVGRWHTSLGDAAAVLANTDNGTLTALPDADLPLRRADALGPWAGAARAMTPSRCVGLQVVMRRGVSGTTVTWTTDLTRVAVMDQVGPTVSAPVVDAAWVTGATVPVRFTQSDNAFNRGEVRAESIGGGLVSLGDPADGAISADVPVGSLPDGQHTVRVSRSAPGWDARTATAAFNLDRTPPAIPEVRVDTDAWTNAAEVWVSSEPSADAASGWSHNEFSVDGGPWVVQANRWAMQSDGVHQVRARAVDRVGHASAASPARTTRIDRTAPTIDRLQVDVAATGGPLLLMQLADEGGSGLGACQAVVSLAGAGSAWTPVVELPGAALARSGEVKLPMRGLPSGDYQIRVRACDMAGNESIRVVRLTWHPSAAPPADALPVPVIGRAPAVDGDTGPAALRIAGATVRRAVFGRRLRIGGTLLRGGRPVADVALQVIDPGGSVVGSGHTTSTGRIIAGATATRGGAWRIRAVGQRWTAAAVRVAVAPVIVARAMTRAGILTVGVHVMPAMAGRTVRLQRLGGTGWATVVTATTAADGTVRIAAPARPGRHRILVPEQRGWDYEGAAVSLRGVVR